MVAFLVARVMPYRHAEQTGADEDFHHRRMVADVRGEAMNPTAYAQEGACYSRRMKWREILPSALKPDNVDPKIAHETLLQIIAERKAREERRKSKAVKSGHTRQAKR